MKKWLSLIILLAVNVISINAQQKNSINNQSMEKKTKTIRLIYPQWQGGDIARWITEIKDPEAASKGYFLGAELLNFLAPDSSQETLTVPISTEITERRKKDGVLDRDIIVKQTKAALDLLRISDPDKIVTLGGECSVSVVPFTYLAEKYKDDVAMIWIDAHPPGRGAGRGVGCLFPPESRPAARGPAAGAAVGERFAADRPDRTGP